MPLAVSEIIVRTPITTVREASNDIWPILFDEYSSAEVIKRIKKDDDSRFSYLKFRLSNLNGSWVSERIGDWKPRMRGHIE